MDSSWTPFCFRKRMQGDQVGSCYIMGSHDKFTKPYLYHLDAENRKTYKEVCLITNKGKVS